MASQAKTFAGCLPTALQRQVQVLARSVANGSDGIVCNICLQY